MNLKLSIVNYQLSIFVALVTFFALPLKAQVTIGAQKAPHSYSVLELMSAKGLRLPMLSNDERDALKLTSDSTEAGGLVIYNTDIDCVEFWSDNKWIDLCNNTSPNLLTNNISLTSAPGTDAQIVCPGTAITPVTYSTTGATGATIIGLPAGVIGSWNAGVVTISGTPATSGSYIIMLTEGSGTATGTITVPQLSAIIGNAVVEKGATNLTYYVPTVPYMYLTSYTWTVPATVGTISGGQGTNKITVDASSTASAPAPAGTISVTVTDRCGAKLVSTLDVTVGCGAYVSSKTDWREFMCYNLGVTDYSADPVNPSQALHGAKYKWGTGLVAVSAVDDQNPDNEAGFGDWLTAAYGGDPPTTLENWDMDTANPCPSSYRVPTDNELIGIATNNTISYIGGWAKSYTSGIKFGNLLFLPAVGSRNGAEGALVYLGGVGYYWSSTCSTLGYAYNMGFLFGSLSPNNSFNRSNGFGVRCIAE